VGIVIAGDRSAVQSEISVNDFSKPFL
jgi:hypothetical protein